METEIECPSGLKGRIRAWKVKDRAIYKDQKVLRSNTLVKELCTRVWLETLDPGPYSLATGKLDWGHVLQGDAFWAFIQSRILSKGNIYVFRVPCRACANSIETPYDLSELVRKDLPEESLEALKNDSPITIDVGDRKISFKLLRTDDNKRIAQIEDNYKLEGDYAILAARLVEVSGLSPGNTQRARFIQELDEGDADRILAAMEEYDCGADVKVKVVCENCYHGWEQNLPLQPSFFQTEKSDLRPKTTMEEETPSEALSG